MTFIIRNLHSPQPRLRNFVIPRGGDSTAEYLVAVCAILVHFREVRYNCTSVRRSELPSPLCARIDMCWPSSCVEAATNRPTDRRSNKINYNGIFRLYERGNTRPSTQRMIHIVVGKTSRTDAAAHPRLEKLTTGLAYPPRS